MNSLVTAQSETLEETWQDPCAPVTSMNRGPRVTVSIGPNGISFAQERRKHADPAKKAKRKRQQKARRRNR